MKADATNQNRRAIILAGGDGPRLSEITRRISDDSIPKRFCSLIEGGSLLEQTRLRVSLAVDKNRILTCSTVRTNVITAIWSMRSCQRTS
jgi:mannose-1-phosphate guanylyltransferase